MAHVGERERAKTTARIKRESANSRNTPAPEPEPPFFAVVHRPSEESNKIKQTLNRFGDKLYPPDLDHQPTAASSHHRHHYSRLRPVSKPPYSSHQSQYKTNGEVRGNLKSGPGPGPGDGGDPGVPHEDLNDQKLQEILNEMSSVKSPVSARLTPRRSQEFKFSPVRDNKSGHCEKSKVSHAKPVESIKDEVALSEESEEEEPVKEHGGISSMGSHSSNVNGNAKHQVRSPKSSESENSSESDSETSSNSSDEGGSPRPQEDKPSWKPSVLFSQESNQSNKNDGEKANAEHSESEINLRSGLQNGKNSHSSPSISSSRRSGRSEASPKKSMSKSRAKQIKRVIPDSNSSDECSSVPPKPKSSASLDLHRETRRRKVAMNDMSDVDDAHRSRKLSYKQSRHKNALPHGESKVRKHIENSQSRKTFSSPRKSHKHEVSSNEDDSEDNGDVNVVDSSPEKTSVRQTLLAQKNSPRTAFPNVKVVQPQVPVSPKSPVRKHGLNRTSECADTVSVENGHSNRKNITRERIHGSQEPILNHVEEKSKKGKEKHKREKRKSKNEVIDISSSDLSPSSDSFEPKVHYINGVPQLICKISRNLIRKLPKASAAKDKNLTREVLEMRTKKESECGSPSEDSTKGRVISNIFKVKRVKRLNSQEKELEREKKEVKPVDLKPKKEEVIEERIPQINIESPHRAIKKEKLSPVREINGGCSPFVSSPCTSPAYHPSKKRRRKDETREHSKERKRSRHKRAKEESSPARSMKREPSSENDSIKMKKNRLEDNKRDMLVVPVSKEVKTSKSSSEVDDKSMKSPLNRPSSSHGEEISNCGVWVAEQPKDDCKYSQKYSHQSSHKQTSLDTSHEDDDAVHISDDSKSGRSMQKPVSSERESRQAHSSSQTPDCSQCLAVSEHESRPRSAPFRSEGLEERIYSLQEPVLGLHPLSHHSQGPYDLIPLANRYFPNGMYSPYKTLSDIEKLKIFSHHESFRDHSSHMVVAKDLKKRADYETDPILKRAKYLKAVLHFLVSGTFLENDSNTDVHSIIKMYIETGRLAHLRCESLICLRIYNMMQERLDRNREIRQSVSSYIKSEVYSNGMHSTSASPSALSPTPSPAGSVNSEVSQSSGYTTSTEGATHRNAGNSNQVGIGLGLTSPHIPPAVSAEMHQHLMKLYRIDENLVRAHELWKEADSHIHHSAISNQIQSCLRLHRRRSMGELQRVFDACDAERCGIVRCSHLLRLAGEFFGSDENNFSSCLNNWYSSSDVITFPEFCQLVAGITEAQDLLERTEENEDGVAPSGRKMHVDEERASPTDRDSAIGGSIASPESSRKVIVSGCSSDRDEENFESYGECDSDSAKMGDDVDGCVLLSPPNSLPPSNFTRRNSWVRRSLRCSPSSANAGSTSSFKRTGSFRNAPKRGTAAVASQLFRTSSFSSGRSSTQDQEDMYSDVSLEEDVLDLNHKVQLLQQQVGVLAENQVNSDDRFSRVRSDNAALQARIMMLEEQLRECEVRAEERLSDEQRRNRDLITRIEREKQLVVENLTIRLSNLEKEKNRLEDDRVCCKTQLDKVTKEHDLLEYRLAEAEAARSSAGEESSKLSEFVKRKEEELRREREHSAKVIEELRCEVERLRVMEETLKKRSPSVDSSNSQIMEYQCSLKQLRDENKNLQEQLEDVQAQLLTSQLEEGRTLISTTEPKSLAAEFEAMSSEEEAHLGSESVEKLKNSLKDAQEINQDLRAYIDGILLNIVENYPQLLEVKKK